jgi:uncharacterized protein (DUF1501 family)
MFRFSEPVSRRDLLKLSAAGVAGASVSGWFGLLAQRAAQAAAGGSKHKSCILLWMGGGPAQSHTFDVKGGGDFKPISTSVAGIQISEHLPKLAEQAKHFAILRSMSTGDGNHGTATYLMHTGFRKGQGGVVYPSVGALVSHEIGARNADLPNFVAVGGTQGAGHLGPHYAPLIVNDFERGLPDLKPVTSMPELDERASLVDELDKAFLEDYQAAAIKAHHTSFERALQLMHSDRTKAFELNKEPAASREAYGTGRFAQGCLLARRLVEAGVAFVEVSLGGWDTHNNTPARIKTLSGQLDQPFAQLLKDLKERSLLDSTLVIWMGEFGRSPGNGQNHFAKAWSTVLAGAGVKGGQVIGSTGGKGSEPEGRPVSAPDFMATICKALDIDYTKSFTVRGRPIAKVNKDAKVVKEVFA